MIFDKSKWKLVPAEATEEMIEAGNAATFSRCIWHDMLSAAPTPPQWQPDEGMVWRKDCFGRERRALYIGKICIGHISDMRPSGLWRAWLQTDEDGDRIGKDDWPRAAAAREAVEIAARAALAAIPEGEKK